MDALTYLHSLGITSRPPTKASVGRLVVANEFDLEGVPGVVVKPKRGNVSDRYLELLAAENVGLIIVDTPPILQMYGQTADGQSFEPIRALPARSTKFFPSDDVFKMIAELLRKRVAAENLLPLEVRLIASKIDDERTNQNRFGPELVSSRNEVPLSEILQGDVEPLFNGKRNDKEAVLKAAALLAGYRLTPETPFETATLLNGLTHIVDGRLQVAGLPASFAFAFSGGWASGNHTLVVSSALGSQLIPLLNAIKGTAFLPGEGLKAREILDRLFPSTSFIETDFLQWLPESPPDRLVVVPPFALSITSPSILNGFNATYRDGKPASRAAAEVLYMDHAVNIAAPEAILVMIVPEGILANVSYADFRSRLLDRVRLLAVLSLPTGLCFAGTAMRCSLLYMQKTDSLPSDYPISMMEIEEEDMKTPEARGELGKVIEDVLKEVV